MTPHLIKLTFSQHNERKKYFKNQRCGQDRLRGDKSKFKQYQEAQQCSELQDDCGVESLKIVLTLISPVFYVWCWITSRLVLWMCCSVSLSILPLCPSLAWHHCCKEFPSLPNPSAHPDSCGTDWRKTLVVASFMDLPFPFWLTGTAIPANG